MKIKYIKHRHTTCELVSTKKQLNTIAMDYALVRLALVNL
jgi:hypothetical protein